MLKNNSSVIFKNHVSCKFICFLYLENYVYHGKENWTSPKSRNTNYQKLQSGKIEDVKLAHCK